MGTFLTPIEIAGTDRERFTPVDALVDTDMPFSMFPAPLLNSLGITPIDKQAFILDSGERVHKDLGEMYVRIDGRLRATPVVFLDDIPRPVLGRITLAAFCLEADHANRRLVPVPAIGLRA